MGEEQKETESTEKEEKKEEAAEEEKEEEPFEIVLKVDMHCEGCARKVEKSLRKFEGVEDVKTDRNSNMVVVKGKTADPVKVCERVQKKTGKKVELISPHPKHPEEENKEAEEEKKKESITVVLKVRMHCEACAQGLQKRIKKMKGVESVVTDLSNDQVIVKGVIDPGVLVENIYRRTRKQASIVHDEEKKEEEKKPEEEEKKPDKEEKEEEKKPEEEEKKEENKEEEKKPEEEKKKEEEEERKPEGEEKKEENKEEEKKEGDEDDEERKHEYLPYRYPVDYVEYAYSPHVFSDENPNACSVM